jgi:MFS family permease
VIVGGFALEMIGLVTLVQAGALPGFMAAMAAFGLGMGCLIPAYDSLVSKVVPEDQRGLAFGLFGTSLGLLSLPFPWIGAQLWERVSPQTPFWVTITASLISIPIAWLTFALPREEMEPISPREGEVGESASPTIAES